MHLYIYIYNNLYLTVSTPVSLQRFVYSVYHTPGVYILSHVIQTGIMGKWCPVWLYHSSLRNIYYSYNVCMAYSEKVAGRYNAIGRVRLSVRLLPLQL